MDRINRMLQAAQGIGMGGGAPGGVSHCGRPRFRHVSLSVVASAAARTGYF